MVTISVHNDSTVCRAHNLRLPNVLKTQTHIDPNGVHETWYDESEADAYKRLFQDAVDEYNNTQTRTDRMIKNYHTKISQSGQQNTAYEVIVGVYGSDCSPEAGYQILRQYYDEWQKRNPNLEIIGAYYHADEEGDPHIHLSYVPVATGYTKGVRKQPGMRRALEQQGFVKNGKETPQIAWELSEQTYLEKLCNLRGLIVDHPGGRKKHLSVEEYKETKETERQRTFAASKVVLNERRALKSNRVTVDADALQILKEREMQLFMIKTEPSIRTRSAVVRKHQNELRKQEEKLRERENKLEEKIYSFEQIERNLKNEQKEYQKEFNFLYSLLEDISEALHNIIERLDLPQFGEEILHRLIRRIDDALGIDTDMSHETYER